ncbi:MAG TPA: winged helix-turn-helix domain-containing protein, partial [Pyrinomonadaceae bacterium]
MSDAPMDIYEFGQFRVDARRRLLLREGNPVRLPAKAFEILLVLLERNGNLVEKDELMRRVWPDAVVEENNLTVNVSALRKSLTESPGEHRYVVTVPGRGYQFVADVQQPVVEPSTERLPNEGRATFDAERSVWSDETNSVLVSGNGESGSASELLATARSNEVAQLPWSRPSAEHIAGEIKKNKQVVLSLLVTLFVTAIIASYFIYSRNIGGKHRDGISSIAVLPFANEIGDPNAEYLSDGISESLINNLSQLPGIKVIARSSVFKFKGKEVDLNDAGKKLGVEAILIGRVTQRGENLSISVELVNASDRTQLWGEQYDHKMSDLLMIQREITNEIVDK